MSKFLDYTGLSYFLDKLKGFFVTLTTDQNITGTKTFVGQKKIQFKQSKNTDKLGFTLFNNNNVEQGYLEYNPSNKIDGAPLMTLGNYATATSGVTHVGFRKYSNISNSQGAYNLLAPLIANARTPFSLTTTYQNFYLPLGVTDGATVTKVDNTGMLNISSLLPNTSAIVSSYISSGGYVTSSYVAGATVANAGNATNAATATNATSLGGSAASVYAKDANVLHSSGGTVIGTLTVDVSSGGQIKLIGLNTETAASSYIPATNSNNYSKFLCGTGDWVDVASAASAGSAGTITSTLPVSKGGTGKTAFTNVNGVITAAGTSTGDLTAVATKAGALYATSANGAAQFGTLPIAQGGTGKTTRLEAFRAINSGSVADPTYFIGLVSDWSSGGYVNIANTQKALKIRSGSTTIKAGGTSITWSSTGSTAANTKVFLQWTPSGAPTNLAYIPCVTNITSTGCTAYALRSSAGSAFAVLSGNQECNVRWFVIAS